MGKLKTALVPRNLQLPTPTPIHTAPPHLPRLEGNGVFVLQLTVHPPIMHRGKVGRCRGEAKAELRTLNKGLERLLGIPFQGMSHCFPHPHFGHTSHHTELDLCSWECAGHSLSQSSQLLSAALESISKLMGTGQVSDLKYSSPKVQGLPEAGAANRRVNHLSMGRECF